MSSLSPHARHWASLWKSGVAASFHLPHVNANLARHVGKLRAASGAEPPRVLLPLCGKTVDLRFLMEQGFTVVGVDCSRLAFQQFAAENPSVAVREATPGVPGFDVFVCSAAGSRGSATLLCGDFMAASVDVLGGEFHALWDRGGLGSVHPDDLTAYARRLRAAMKPDAVALVEQMWFAKDTSHFATEKALRGAVRAAGLQITEEELRDVTGEYPHVVAAEPTQRVVEAVWLLKTV